MGQLLTSSSQLVCPHQGIVQAITSNVRAQADGGFILRASDTFVITGCPFSLGPSPHPCVSVKWLVSALRHQAAGDAALTTDSVGMCLAADQAPQGVVMVNSTQSRVSGL